MQEYVEAVTFLSYLQHSSLPDPEQLQAELDAACAANPGPHRIPLDPADYVLGVADLTGELMRAGVAAAGEGDLERVDAVRKFLTEIENGLAPLGGCGPRIGRDFSSKMRVLRQSVMKVEKSCFDITVRRAEFGDHTLPFLATGPDTKRRRLE